MPITHRDRTKAARVDNLRAAIVHAALYDPDVQRTYRECAEYYGFLIAPCRPRTKGKWNRAGLLCQAQRRGRPDLPRHPRRQSASPAHDPAIIREILAHYARTLLAFYARTARAHGIQDGQTGTVTVIQRFGSGLQLNVHFHTLVLDGVFSEAPPGP